MHLGEVNDIFAPIHAGELTIRRALNDTSTEGQGKLIVDFLDALFDLAGVARE
jgi:hypothetical protein